MGNKYSWGKINQRIFFFPRKMCQCFIFNKIWQKNMLSPLLSTWSYVYQLLFGIRKTPEADTDLLQTFRRRVINSLFNDSIKALISSTNFAEDLDPPLWSLHQFVYDVSAMTSLYRSFWGRNSSYLFTNFYVFKLVNLNFLFFELRKKGPLEQNGISRVRHLMCPVSYVSGISHVQQKNKYPWSDIWTDFHLQKYLYR